MPDLTATAAFALRETAASLRAEAEDCVYTGSAGFFRAIVLWNTASQYDHAADRIEAGSE